MVDAADSDSFAVLTREKEVIRLGHETLQKSQLAPEAIERAANCIKRFRTIAEGRGTETIIVVATASVRDAANSAQFIKEIQKQTGLRVEILSGVEEARLIGLAASRGCIASDVKGINIDIGGGSTEVSIFRRGASLKLFSVKLGAIGLTERYLTTDPPKSQELNQLKREIRGAFERPVRELRNGKWQQATGTSGTILALGATLQARSTTELERRHQAAQPTGTEIRFRHLTRLNTELAAISQAERREVAGISSQRSDIIIAGGQILEGAMRAFGIDVLRTCDWALREGVIIDRLREWEDESRSLTPNFADQKLRGVHAVGRRFGYEEGHAHHVAKLAANIFDGIAAPENLSRHHRTLMLAAALLHDVGYHIAHESHHKHSYYLIANSELTGFSEAERSVIANAARYHRGSLPKDRHPPYAVLNAADKETVNRLGAIVRLADALDRSHDCRVQKVTCNEREGITNIELYSELDCENELIEAERKRDLFEEAFQRTLNLTVRRTKSKRD